MRLFTRIKVNNELLKDNRVLRSALLEWIADFSKWDNCRDSDYTTTCQSLTRAAYSHSDSAAEGRPVLVDTFAGGGAIPLEGLRAGAEVLASDINPLSVLINSVLLRYAPTHGRRLAEAVETWGNAVNKEAKAHLSEFYPANSENRAPIVFLWARTILSEAPSENGLPVEVPAIRSMWLARKGTKVAMRWKTDRTGRIEFEVVSRTYSNGQTLEVRRPVLEVFYPKDSSEVPRGTTARGGVTCPITHFTTPAKSVQRQLGSRHGGADDARLYCVVSVAAGVEGRFYSVPSENDLKAYGRAQVRRRQREDAGSGRSVFPNEPLPVMSGVFNAPLYGHTTWGSIFNSRQLLAMTTYVDLARAAIADALITDRSFGLALAATLALLIDRLADLNCALCGWQLSTPNTAHVFTRWALPMMMDYGEVNPLAGAGGSPESAVWRIASAIRDVADAIPRSGHVSQQSADANVYPDDSVDLFVTDPPYYNAVPYADISDFFYVWLIRTIGDVFPELFSSPLTPKDAEICEMAGWDPVRYPHKDKAFFERRMQGACERAREFLRPDGLAVIVFAHKSTSGWEAMLRAVIDAGWTITASWPIDTEMASRLRAQRSAALASSIHLVCRPRQSIDGARQSELIGDWRQVLESLPKRIHEWMPRLAEEGVVGADAIFACLGPALEIFSRYSRVEKASGEVVTLREYLEQVWAAVSTEALSMIFRDADAAGLESDARFTAIVLWTLGSAAASGSGSDAEDDEDSDDEEDDDVPKGKAAKGGFSLEYDAARKIAQGLGVNLEQIASVVEVKGAKARLLPVSERAAALFGKAEKAEAAAKKRGKKVSQKKLFDTGEKESGGGGLVAGIPDGTGATPGATVLDRIHQSMLLFAGGQAEALKRFIVEDGVGVDARFWKLAQSLSALYPAGSEEKRWVDGVLARKKSFGF